jgi:hypothetical protein
MQHFQFQVNQVQEMLCFITFCAFIYKPFPINLHSLPHCISLWYHQFCYILADSKELKITNMSSLEWWSYQVFVQYLLTKNGLFWDVTQCGS